MNRNDLLSLERLDILDTEDEQSYDNITRLASYVCETPIALICFLDNQRQWFKSNLGLDTKETARDLAFCSYTIMGENIMIIKDATKDKRTLDNPLVTDHPNIRFYAGVPLAVDKGLNVGTLCVIDTKARELSDEQYKCLEMLGALAVSELELRLSKKEEKTFFFSIAHELRNCLTPILFGLEQMENNQSLDSINMVSQSAQQMKQIANDLLDIGKIDGEKFSLTLKTGDLNNCIKTTLEQLKPMLLKNIVSVNLDPSLPPLQFDAVRIQQVITNYIQNALRHTKQKILISSSRDKQLALVSISDDGAGIALKDQHKIFTLFDSKEGTGLGLYICKHLIELHGGSVGFESTQDKGTTFFFTLPLSKSSN